MNIDPDVEVLLSALEARIANLEAGSVGDITDLENRVSTLETQVNIPVNPNTVVQFYDDGSSITYKKE
jgi:hypothetical protein